MDIQTTAMSDEPGHSKVGSGSSGESIQIPIEHNAPIHDSKPLIVQEILERVADMEVFYPFLDDAVMESNDLTFEDWLDASRTKREEWRDIYDPDRTARVNGFIRDNEQSIINKVLMEVLFRTARLAELQGKPIVNRPVIPEGLVCKPNLVKEIVGSSSESSSISRNKLVRPMPSALFRMMTMQLESLRPLVKFSYRMKSQVIQNLLRFDSVPYRFHLPARTSLLVPITRNDMHNTQALDPQNLSRRTLNMWWMR
jgi:hypothetical protein